MRYFTLTLSFYFLFPILIWGQFCNVKGIVTDVENNPISNATVYPTNMYFCDGIGGKTSKQGIFDIIVPIDSILLIEHISYQTRPITLKELKKSHFHIRLHEKIELLDTIVINDGGYLVKTSNKTEREKQIELSALSTFQKNFNLGITRIDSLNLSTTEELIQIHTYYPEYPGGIRNMMQNIYKKLQPLTLSITNKEKEAIHLSISFTINKTGYCEDINIVQKTNTLIDDLVFEAIQTMPRWKPAVQFGKPVFMKFVLPIIFQPNYKEN